MNEWSEIGINLQVIELIPQVMTVLSTTKPLYGYFYNLLRVLHSEKHWIIAQKVLMLRWEHKDIYCIT